jgi:hypothetical protein
VLLFVDGGTCRGEGRRGQEGRIPKLREGMSHAAVRMKAPRTRPVMSERRTTCVCLDLSMRPLRRYLWMYGRPRKTVRLTAGMMERRRVICNDDMYKLVLKKERWGNLASLE